MGESHTARASAAVNTSASHDASLSVPARLSRRSVLRSMSPLTDTAHSPESPAKLCRRQEALGQNPYPPGCWTRATPPPGVRSKEKPDRSFTPPEGTLRLRAAGSEPEHRQGFPGPTGPTVPGLVAETGGTAAVSTLALMTGKFRLQGREANPSAPPFLARPFGWSLVGRGSGTVADRSGFVGYPCGKRVTAEAKCRACRWSRESGGASFVWQPRRPDRLTRAAGGFGCGPSADGQPRGHRAQRG